MTDHPAPTTRRPALPRWFGILLLAEAATFGVASYLHRDGHIALGFTTVTGEHFPKAALPEAIIGAVLAVAGGVVLAAPSRARAVAATATGFAILGVIVGLTVVLGSTRFGVADVGYHAGILAVLLGSMYLLGSAGRDAGPPPGARRDDHSAMPTGS